MSTAIYVRVSFYKINCSSVVADAVATSMQEQARVWWSTEATAVSDAIRTRICHELAEQTMHVHRVEGSATHSVS
jgi:hypothetical protein